MNGMPLWLVADCFDPAVTPDTPLFLTPSKHYFWQYLSKAGKRLKRWRNGTACLLLAGLCTQHSPANPIEMQAARQNPGLMPLVSAGYPDCLVASSQALSA